MNKQSSLPVIEAQWQAPSNVRAFATTCAGGISERNFVSLNTAFHVGDNFEHVTENRQRIAHHYADARQWQWLDQEHGKTVHKITQAGEVLRGDGLVTGESGLVCCVMTADCLPIFLAAKRGDEVAVAHGGWKGLVAGVIEHTIKAMDSDGSELVAWLGPAIGPCHFEVGAEVLNQFMQTDDSGEMRAQFTQQKMQQKTQQKNSTYMADIYGIARRQLSRLGVDAISGGEYCTYCDARQFYSYRRDGQSGRMLNAIYLV